MHIWASTQPMFFIPMGKCIRMETDFRLYIGMTQASEITRTKKTGNQVVTFISFTKRVSLIVIEIDWWLVWNYYSVLGTQNQCLVQICFVNHWLSPPISFVVDYISIKFPFLVRLHMCGYHGLNITISQIWWISKTYLWRWEITINYMTIYQLVGGLEHDFYFSIYWECR